MIRYKGLFQTIQLLLIPSNKKRRKNEKTIPSNKGVETTTTNSESIRETELMKQIEDECRECEALQISLKDLTRRKVRLEKYSSSQRNIAITSKSIKGKKKDILETKERMKQTEKI